MITRAAFLFIFALIASCASAPKVSARLNAFYEQARHRQQRKSNVAPDPSGLHFVLGTGVGAGRFPSENESAIVVSESAFPERGAVQVIVHPRVSGSFLDPADPSPDFLDQQKADIEHALKTHEYRDVYWVSLAARQ